MREARRVLLLAIAWAVMTVPTGSFAKDKPPKDKAASPAPTEKAGHESVNACGCYRNPKGGCVCTDKKGKCECPGECEPVGCDKKRELDLEREMAAEVKRAQDDEKRRRETEEAKERTAAADSGITPDPTEAPAKAEPPPAKSAKGAKPARKDTSKSGAKNETAADSAAAAK